MTADDALQKVLPLYSEYYTVTAGGDAAAPFRAEAECVVNDEQYAAYRTVKISAVISRELVFFATADSLDTEQALALAEAAWKEGLRRVEPGPNHRNTDIVLVALTESLSDGAARALTKLRRVKNYKYTFHGGSTLRVVAIETSAGRMVFNRLGRSLKKLYGNIHF